MYCNKCGKEIDDEALICPYCGCGTVNYIRDQAKAESRAREPRQPAQKKRSTAIKEKEPAAMKHPDATAIKEKEPSAIKHPDSTAIKEKDPSAIAGSMITSSQTTPGARSTMSTRMA